MPYSFQVHSPAVSTSNFSFAQIDGYVTTANLSVFVNGVLQATSGVYTINTTTVNIQFITPILGGNLVVIRRFTEALRADREVDFDDGSILTASDLDNSALQLLYLVQEGLDEAKEFSLRLNDMLTAWDAVGLKITNVATPTLSTDAANKAYVDSAAFGSISGAANLVLATPTSSSGAVTLRALVPADIPTLTAAKISNFDTQVQTSRLNQMNSPNASVSLNSQKITDLLTPTAPADGANKSYVDSVVFNLNPQVVVATNSISTGFKIDIDVNLIEPRRLAQINTTLTIGTMASVTHYIRVKNTGASAVKYMVLWGEFSWGPLPSSGFSNTVSPTNVSNLPWNFNSTYYTQGITTLAAGSFAYFQGTGSGWTGTADISDPSILFGSPATGASADVKAWILRLT
jgi:hypothetical protein